MFSSLRRTRWEGEIHGPATWTETVPGEFLGIPGNGRRITFRLLHVWEFRHGLISRENVWLDGGSVLAQLTAPELAGTPTAT